MKILNLSALLLCTTSAWGAYSYYLTDTLTSIDPSKWSSTGAVAPGAAGLSAPGASGGTLVSRVPIPDGTAEGEVAITLTLAAAGGAYTEFLQASPDASTGPASSGTFFAFEMQNPTFNTAHTSCSANFVLFQGVAGTISVISTFQHSCRSGMVMRLVVHGTVAAVYPDQAEPMEFTIAPNSSGQPAIGAYGMPAGNSISLVQLGAIDRTSPPAIDGTKLRMSVFREHIDLQWAAVSKATSSVAMAAYWVYRNGDYLVRTYGTSFSDDAVQPGGQYTYTIVGVDGHYNVSPSVSVTAAVPVPKLGPVAGNLPTPGANVAAAVRAGGSPHAQAVQVGTPQADSGGGLDPRRVGVRALGSYWGTSGENIDTASGNLNFSIPLLTAKAATGWGVTFALSYNSQIWRHDSSGSKLLGLDTGYV